MSPTLLPCLSGSVFRIASRLGRRAFGNAGIPQRLGLTLFRSLSLSNGEASTLSSSHAFGDDSSDAGGFGIARDLAFRRSKGITLSTLSGCGS